MGDWESTEGACACGRGLHVTSANALKIVAQAIALDLTKAGIHEGERLTMELLVSEGVPPMIACKPSVERWVVVMRITQKERKGSFVLASFDHPDVAMAFAEFAEEFFAHMDEEIMGATRQPQPQPPSPSRQGDQGLN